MGSEEVLESSAIMHATISSCNGSVVQHVDDVEESENPGVNLLKDLDLYWEDIEDRLTISRMVSDSVIKGMVSAVEQDAVEKIARKELELAGLRETLHLYHVGADDNESSRCSRISCEVKSRTCGLYATYSDAFLEHDRLQESLGNLKIAAEEQFEKLKIEIEKVRGSSSMKRKSSASELVGLGGILSESDNWDYVDRMFNSLRTTLDSFYKGADDVITRSKSSLLEWQQETEFQAEIEGMVMQNCIRSLQEEFEQRLWDQNTSSRGNGDPDWLELVKEISSLRQELDTISKSLAIPESGQLISHGSLESRKSSGNHVPSTTALWEGNGKNEESIITMPENLDAVQLKHLSRDELFNYFKTEITKMKRQHELKVQEMTEYFFSLKRDYWNERGSSFPVRKDKEFDMLRKKIPDVILKLDDILVETEKLPKMSNNAESLDSLKERLELLCLKNHELQDLLTQKEKEIKFLSSQISDAVEKTSEQSLAEVKLSRTIAILRSSMEDAHIEASISEDLHQFLLREFTNHIKCSIKESDLQYDLVEGIHQALPREATQNAKVASKFEIEDSDMESFIMQGLCEVIFPKALREAEEKISDLNVKYVDENLVRLSLEMELAEKEKALRSNISQKEKLEQEILLLEAAIQKKEKLVQESADALKNERENFELASQELDSLRMQSSQQHLLISKSNKELQIIKRDLDWALEKNKLYKLEIDALQERLQLEIKSLRETDEEKRILLAVSSEKQSLFEAREREHREQLDSIIVLVNGLSRAVIDFESKASKDIKRDSLRLETLSSQLASLIQNANNLKRTGLLYKQKLERRCSDLHKAEAEVDLLGDEVETLLSLLEKIYIALDHYSPILRHYPGITEILKLVKRELSGEYLKPV